MWQRAERVKRREEEMTTGCCLNSQEEKERSPGTHESRRPSFPNLVFQRAICIPSSANTPPALSALHGRLFKFKSIGTLPLTDCKRRFIRGPAAALQSVIVIQPEERVVVAARSSWTSVCQRRPAFINRHRFVLKDPPGDAGHCRTTHTVVFRDQQQESFQPLWFS